MECPIWFDKFVFNIHKWYCWQHKFYYNLFADDSVVYRQINSPDYPRILQKDLQKLVEWSLKPGK